MLSLQEISDRLEIQQVLATYSAAIDGQMWDLLDEVFIESADIDYFEVAGFRGDREALKRVLAQGLPAGRCYYHLTSCGPIRIQGDKASVSSPCINPMPSAEAVVGVYGLWYNDELVRANGGWRIGRRALEFCYFGELASPSGDPFSPPVRR